MFRNYFKTAFRNLSKSKFFSFIHISGLSIGAAACLLIFQYVYFEQSYDDFHERVEDIYRVPIRYSEGFGNFPKMASNHPGLGPAMMDNFPEVQVFTRVLNSSNIGSQLEFSYINSEGQRINTKDDRSFLADSSFFQIFPYPFIYGDRNTALNGPNSMVMSASMAEKYFGKGDPVGKTIQLNGNRDITVKGVIEDIPENTHLKFNALFSLTTFFPKEISQKNAWIWPEFYTYVLLQPGTDPAVLEAKFPEITERYMTEIHKEHNFQTYFYLQPVADIHLKSDCGNEPSVPGSERMVYFLTLLGLFILVIAWVNYINLSTSKSIDRAKEVGVRKVVGATKGQLTGQFLTEAILLNTIGILLGFLLARAALPYFTKVVGKEIGDTMLSVDLLTQPVFWLTIIACILLGGLFSGIYPAVVLSSFRPVQVLKGSLFKSNQSISFRKILVGFQFVLSILLIAATLLVTRQLSYMSKKELGYNKEQLLIMNAPTVSDSITYVKSQSFPNELKRLAAIEAMTKSSEVPGKLIAFRGEGRKSGMTKDQNTSFFFNKVDDQFLSVYQMPIVAGRNFETADSTTIFRRDDNKILVNEELVSILGFADAATIVGENITFKLGPIEHKGEVIGVVQNYHQRSLKEAYDPILYYYPTFTGWNYYTFRMETGDWKNTIAEIEEKFKTTFPKSTFDYFFLDEFFDRQYRADQQFSKVCIIMAGLAIFVACLGFFGLSALILIQRRKEIGVRKILGASPSTILKLVTKDFVLMLLLAQLIALPLIIYFGRQWLNNFAFSNGIGWVVFIVPLVILLLIVFGIVGVQIYRSTVLNPIQALRSE